jgi:hypothetical protein
VRHYRPRIPLQRAPGGTPPAVVGYRPAVHATAHLNESNARVALEAGRLGVESDELRVAATQPLVKRQYVIERVDEVKSHITQRHYDTPLVSVVSTASDDTRFSYSSRRSRNA